VALKRCISASGFAWTPAAGIVLCYPAHSAVAGAIIPIWTHSCPFVYTTTYTLPGICLQATGYVDFDTAGQSNMYPVVTKAYEAGSDQDTADSGAANTVVGAGAAVIAVAVLALGLGALSQLGAGEHSQQRACWHNTVGLEMHDAK
jgi:uncharacterized membrane protein